jgi:hypothetical protein
LFYKKKLLQKDTFFISSHHWILQENLGNNNFEFNHSLTSRNGWLLNLPSDLSNEGTDHIIYYNKFNTDAKNMTFTTRFALKFSKTNNKLHKATIGFDFTGGMIDLGFVNEGFKNSAHLMLGKAGQTISGAYSDLSYLEISNNTKYALKIHKDSNQVHAWLNDKQIFSKPLFNPLGSFEGLNFHSSDTLAIDHVTIRSGNQTIYKEDFENR